MSPTGCVAPANTVAYPNGGGYANRVDGRNAFPKLSC